MSYDDVRRKARATMKACIEEHARLGGVGPVVVPPWVFDALRDEIDPLPMTPDPGPFFATGPIPETKWSNEPCRWVSIAELKGAKP